MGLTQSQNYTAEYGFAILKFISDASAAERIRSELDNVSDFMAYAANMEKEYSLNLSGLDASENYFAAVKEACMRWKENISALRERTSLETSFNELEMLGLQTVVNAIKENRVSGEDLIPAFEHSLNRIIIFNAFRNDPGLSEFQEAQFEDTIKKYREVISRFRSLTIQELVARLSAKIPDVSVGSGDRRIFSGGVRRKLFHSYRTGAFKARLHGKMRRRLQRVQNRCRNSKSRRSGYLYAWHTLRQQAAVRENNCTGQKCCSAVRS